MMKAFRVTKNGSNLAQELVTVKKPTLRPGYALVKVRASAINPSDVGNSKGWFPHTTFPRTMGRDHSGVVEDGPSHLKGLEVYGTSGPDFSFTEDGAHAEYCLVREDALAPKPTNLSFAQAATIGVPFTTATSVLQRAYTTATDKVLVLGANGAVGSAAIQIARLMGCRVFTAARSDAADVNLVKDPSLSNAMGLVEGSGFDVIVDAVGDVALMRSAWGF